jgi:hypothetical protein
MIDFDNMTMEQENDLLNKKVKVKGMEGVYIIKQITKYKNRENEVKRFFMLIKESCIDIDKNPFYDLYVGQNQIILLPEKQ